MKGQNRLGSLDFQGIFARSMRVFGACARKFHAYLLLIALNVSAQTPKFGITQVGESPAPESFQIVSAMPQGNVLFSVAYEGFLFAHDITDPKRPIELSRVQIGLYPNRVFLAGNLAAIAGDRTGIDLVDISDPRNVRLISQTLGAGSAVEDVVVKGDVLFATVTYGGVFMFDISDPTNPKYLRQLESARIGGIALEGNTLVVSTLQYRYETVIYDVTDPRDPISVAAVSSTGSGKIVLAGNRLFTGDLLTIPYYDLSNRGAPQLIGYLVPIAGIDEMVVSGDFMYVLNRGELEAMDLRDPNSGSWQIRPIEMNYREARVFDGKLFAVNSDGAVEMFDLAGQTPPARSGFLNLHARAHELKIVGTTGYLANEGAGLEILDLSDSSNIRLLGVTRGFSAFGCEVRGNFAYVAAGYDGLQIWDVSDPHAPVLKSQSAATNKAIHVAVKDSVAYVVDERVQIIAMDVSDPVNPRALPVPILDPESRTVAVAGNTLFAGGETWVTQYNVADATAPQYASFVSFNGAQRWLNARDNTLLAATYGAVYVFDVSDPKNARPRGFIYQDSADGALANDYVYLAGYFGLTIVDGLYPTHTASVASATTDLAATAVAVSGQTVFVGKSNGGLVAFQTAAPPRVRVKPPILGARHHARDTVRIDWSVELISNPVWSLELQGKSLPASPVFDGGALWHADITIPESATNAWQTWITVRDTNSRAEGYYETFALELDPKLQLTRQADQLQLQWSSVHTNYSLFRGTNTSNPTAWQKISGSSIVSTENTVSFKEKTAGTAFFQLRRNTP